MFSEIYEGFGRLTGADWTTICLVIIELASERIVAKGPEPRAGSPPNFLIVNIIPKGINVFIVSDRKDAKLIIEAIPRSCQKTDTVKKRSALIINVHRG
jgi:hypothetical protein